MDYYCINCDIIISNGEVFVDRSIDPYEEELIIVNKCPHCKEKLSIDKKENI